MHTHTHTYRLCRGGGPLGNQGLPVHCELRCLCFGMFRSCPKREALCENVCVHPFCVYKMLPLPHGVLHCESGYYSFIIWLFSSLHVIVLLLVASSSIRASSVYTFDGISLFFHLPFHRCSLAVVRCFMACL